MFRNSNENKRLNSFCWKSFYCTIVLTIETQLTIETFQTAKPKAFQAILTMNKPFTILLTALLFACATAATRNDATIGFSKVKHDFGMIPNKKEVACTFEFTNTGKTALVIYDVKTSCGCTVPEWTRKPILPGEKGWLKIKYDAAFPGVFHKTVEVIYNGTGSPVSLEINGEVEYPENSEL